MFDQSPFLSNAQIDPCMTSKHRESYREQMALRAFVSLVCAKLPQIEHTSPRLTLRETVPFDGTLTLTLACKYVIVMEVRHCELS